PGDPGSAPRRRRRTSRAGGRRVWRHRSSYGREIIGNCAPQHGLPRRRPRFVAYGKAAAAAMGGNDSPTAGRDSSTVLSGPTVGIYCRANNCRIPAAPADGNGGTAGTVAGSRGESAEKVVAHLFQREPDS